MAADVTKPLKGDDLILLVGTIGLFPYLCPLCLIATSDDTQGFFRMVVANLLHPIHTIRIIETYTLDVVGAFQADSLILNSIIGKAEIVLVTLVCANSKQSDESPDIFIRTFLFDFFGPYVFSTIVISLDCTFLSVI
jgi:hypothetical protein